MITINYMAVLACGIASMIVGALWYGPLFGKMWAKCIGTDTMSPEECKKMQKKAGPLYAVQFLLTLFQVYVLAYFIVIIPTKTPMEVSIWMWVGIVLPLIAGGSLWNNDSKKIAWTKFFLQAGYQLVMFVIFGYILGIWQ